jgi:hypothetical protein
LKAKVLFPRMPSRVEKARQFSGLGVDTTKVRAFMQIAAQTAEGEVPQGVRTAMLPRDDVIQFKGCRLVCVGKVAVFAPMRRAAPYLLPGALVHELPLKRPSFV